MKRLFFRTFFTFVTALLILVAVMALASVLGFRRSLAEWSRARSLQIESVALEILKRYPESISVRIPENTPLFVYDSNGNLIFTNRGQAGRGRGAAGAQAGEELIPLQDNDSTVGYYRTGRMHFQDDEANSRFFESINRTIWLGLVLALLIALPFALFFSRSLSVPAVRLARGLDRIAHGVLGVRIAERGAEEIALIARSANRLSDQLQHEQDIRRRWIQDITHDLRTPRAVPNRNPGGRPRRAHEA
jgi:methyl-accepting chemotaxis protein